MLDSFDIAVVGSGPAGQIAAIAMARGGRRVALVGPESAASDRRTTALMHQSLEVMSRLGLWDAMKPQSAALSTMQILDGTTRLLRAPTVAFRASEIDLEAFGYNIPNSVLLETLAQAVAAESMITRLTATADAVDITQERVQLSLSDGKTLSAAFLIGADGKRSKTRDAAGIGLKTWSYPQTAVVLNFTHSRPHLNVSTEFHTETGPFTQVPLPGQRSSLVWVVTPENAERLLSLSLDALSREVERRMQSLLGEVTVEDGAQAWPLSGMTAHKYGKGRVALIGEAAHAFPPIGAQGLNLSLRDIVALEDILTDRSGHAIPADAGDRFDRRRKPDIASRTVSVDLLNRSLLSGLLPVQMLRAGGLQVLSSVSPLRHLVMQEGVAPGRSLKNLRGILREKIRR